MKELSGKKGDKMDRLRWLPTKTETLKGTQLNKRRHHLLTLN